MGSNSFGTLFKITTWGESHGKAIGVVIDGCPAGLEISEEEIQKELSFRQPGKSPYTTPRQEKDYIKISSGVFEGKTTGSPLSLVILNQDIDSSKYEPIKDVFRPGHANFTYLEKYGIFDYRGAGRSSARETACRVAAGAVAKKLLSHFNISVAAYVVEIGGIAIESQDYSDLLALKKRIESNSLFCPDPIAVEKITEKLEEIKKQGDSLGGIVEFVAAPMPTGLGDPVYEKLEANLAKAMLSLPASKGFEIGSGFASARMKGSEHNDPFHQEEGRVVTASNHSGGVLGGISTGMPLIGRTAFKPTSSIRQEQQTLTIKKELTSFTLPEGSRHDPCVAIRAVPVVEAMTALVLADAFLVNRLARVDSREFQKL